MDGHFIVGTAIARAYSCTVVSNSITSVEGELDIFSLSLLQDTRNRENVEDLVDREALVLLALLFLLTLIELFSFVNDGDVFEEGPFVGHGHFRNVGQDEVLLLAGVVEDAAEVDLGGLNLQVGEADLTLKLDVLLVWVTLMRNHKFSINMVTNTVLLHSRIKINLNRVRLILLKCQFLNRA